MSDNYLNRICGICGKPFGYHQHTTDKCPSGNKRDGLYKESTFVNIKHMKESELSPDVRIMQTVPKFNYLVNAGETLGVNELRSRILFCPSIMDEPELQIAAQLFKDSTIESVTRNHAGYWWNFKAQL